MIRLHGDLHAVQGVPVLSGDDAHELIWQLLNEEQRQRYEQKPDLDLAYQYGEKARFRANVYRQQGSAAASLRLIPTKLPTIEDLSLPPICTELTKINQGLVLVTGPTGSGKSSTLAAMINAINYERAEHIVTIEDPIEFIHKPNLSVFSQRQVGIDSMSWADALRSGLRQDPNVVLIGEMRDLETMQAAITMAETGHLVFATLHTNSGPETINRMVDAFPSEQQDQVRQQLSAGLRGVLSQRLIKRSDGKGRVAAFEALINTSAIANLIRESKTHQIESVMQTGSNVGMMLLEHHLAQLVRAGKLQAEVAQHHAIRPAEFARLMGN